MTSPPGLKMYCNHLALEKGLDPGGHATAFEMLLLLEAPLPWRKDMYSTPGTMPPEVLALFALQSQKYQATGLWPPVYLFLIAPDTAYSRRGMRRVILFRRDRPRIAQFARTEYQVPEAEAGPLAWALLAEPTAAANFDRWRVMSGESIRDLLVCTHGTVDAACAKFGFPLYHYLRENYASDSLRVWRVSHFGGHVFAPTMMDMPTGHFWAYVEEAQAAQIVQHEGDVSVLRGHYRGWAGLPNGFLQAAEREMWLREGWDWFNVCKQGELLVQDNSLPPTWAEICLKFDEGGKTCSYQTRVEVVQTIDTPHTTGYKETYSYPQYRVAKLVRLADSLLLPATDFLTVPL